MFNAISWPLLLEILLILTGTYYAFVFLTYYRRDGLGLIRSHFSPRPVSEPKFSEVHELLEDFKRLFALAAKTAMIKEELLQALKSHIREYPGLRDKPFKEDLSEHIRIEAREICGITFGEKELAGLW